MRGANLKQAAEIVANKTVDPLQENTNRRTIFN